MDISSFLPCILGPRALRVLDRYPEAYFLTTKTIERTKSMKTNGICDGPKFNELKNPSKQSLSTYLDTTTP
jgi:hypothetical protein